MNKKPPYRVIITTSNDYLPALRPMAWLMEKYWQPLPDVIVGGFNQPSFELPGNWQFHSIGKQQDYPWGKWSDALIELLKFVNDDVVLLMLEDMWPVRTVDTEAIEILYHYMIQFEYVAKMDLFTDRLYAHGADKTYGTVNRLDLIKSMPGSPYHFSCMPGLWRTEHILSALVPGENPHQVEMNGTPRLSHNQDVIVLGTHQCPLRTTLALRGGDSGKLLTGEIVADDVEKMRELGLLERWE